MIIATLPFEPSRVIRTFKKAYEDQKVSYNNTASPSNRSFTIAPKAVEKARMAVRAGKITIISELTLLSLV